MKAPIILIVDDNEVNRKLLQRMLMDKNYESICAEDGQQALDMLQTEDVDVVLLDIMMPVMDGLTTLKLLRANEKTARLPVILVSALSDSKDVVRGLELGANDYISKPVDSDIAVARVNTQLALKQLMDEREQTIQQMEDAQQMRERFFHMASHDLKQPVTNILMAIALLEGFTEDTDAKAHSVLETMRLSTKTMSNVINDFLDSAALQSGEIDMHIKTVPARKPLGDVITQHMPTAYDKSITIDAADTEAHIQCDVDRYMQVMSNILSNAIKYSPARSTVRLWAQPEDNELVVYIADQGQGIPENERMKLFQPFGKLSTRPTGGESSHGLGLWIAQHLIRLQGGDIGVESPPEGGSIFWVSIPLAA